MSNFDTIAAIATPVGVGGISIVKISGSDAVDAVGAIFRPRKAEKILGSTGSQTMILGHIYEHPRTCPLDEVLVSFFRGPHSYTGEDVVEINCHGGVEVSGAVLDLLLGRGVRLAEPGEFTRRAFLNGRMDLTQVEGTIEIIHAKTRRAAMLASQMLTRGVGSRIERLRAQITDSRAIVEAAIDFPEEDDTGFHSEELRRRIGESILPQIEEMSAGLRESHAVRNGLRVVLAGRPNVGKSSLMNLLLRKERVIVTDHPGTTRDTVEEGFEIEGIPILLSDTAGLGVSDDPIEKIGQEKTREAIDHADLVLMMIDASLPTCEVERELADQLSDRPYLLVRNKIDLVPSVHARQGGDLCEREMSVDISVREREGIADLKKSILRLAGLEYGAVGSGCLPNLRQAHLLREVSNRLATILRAGVNPPLELIAVDLKDAERLLDQVLGAGVERDVLDAIFNRFCIGK